MGGNIFKQISKIEIMELICWCSYGLLCPTLKNNFYTNILFFSENLGGQMKLDRQLGIPGLNPVLSLPVFQVHTAVCRGAHPTSTSVGG